MISSTLAIRNAPWRTSTHEKCSRAQGVKSMVWGRGTPVGSAIISYMTSACGLLRLLLWTLSITSTDRLLFYSKPAKGAMAKSKCDACGKSVKGYILRCNTCNFQMHPCCAMLPGDIVFSSHPHALKLLPAFAIPCGGTGFTCGECKKKKPGRVYHCTVCEYHLHAVCAKSIFNGLHDCGIKEVDKPSVLGTAGTVAALVIKDFAGVVVEGIGQGLGIVQNLVSFKLMTLNDTISHQGRS